MNDPVKALGTDFWHVWHLAHGVKSGFFGWAKASVVKGDSDAVVHAFRVGKGVKSGQCGYAFPGKIELPHAMDKMCGLCAARVRELDAVLES